MINNDIHATFRVFVHEGMMQWFKNDVEVGTRDVTEICRVRCGFRIVYAGYRMSFREQRKEFVAFGTQETGIYIYRRGKPLAQDTDEPWFKYNTAG